MTETDQPIKVRLVRGKPVADIDSLRKYHREYYHRQQARVRVRALSQQVLQGERLGPAPAIRAEVPPAKSKG